MMATIEINRRVLTVRSTFTSMHPCDGEEVVLKVTGPRTARVLWSSRCGLDRSSGCDGVPLFVPGEYVALPPEWGRSGRLEIGDLASALPEDEENDECA